MSSFAKSAIFRENEQIPQLAQGKIFTQLSQLGVLPDARKIGHPALTRNSGEDFTRSHLKVVFDEKKKKKKF